MNVLLVGSGGREHALAWKLRQSPRLKKLYAVPGSDAIAGLAELAHIDPKNFRALAAFCRDKGIGLAVVGPEDPLAAGLADELGAAGVPVFGPRSAAARLEASKAFAKDFMLRHKIPCARSYTASDPGAAERTLKSLGGAAVVKADGLAAGKGVRVCADPEEALRAARDLLGGSLGPAGRTVVLEERLEGREVTYMGLCDGRTFLPLPPSSDHKRLLDGGLGPNTGGMGVLAPAPLDEALRARIRSEIVDRALAGLKADGLDYCGVLYCGLMLTASGPKVLEFNVRFGDPETQAVLPLLEADLLELMEDAARGELSRKEEPRWNGASVCVVLASEGYPGAPKTGRTIEGLGVEPPEGTQVFHAGTRKDGGAWRTKGGRVLGVTGLGRDLEQARERAYSAVGKIRFEGMRFRKDIGMMGPGT